ncbi:teneurin-m-like isoform X3 [Gigantopelta aegis]|uniref:teneurin-m-like isoform X3 n=1 Tax=Gigantopelta aegis TaxID=1735272 RepID=UPI001B889D9C|nr:teneurin-m-like isoform X3 [Gigantopelta aegis]
MDGAFNYSGRQKPHTRAQRRTRMKNRGSQTCSSSDEEFHSDDNLRPYEEVKIAHHDKKLTGLGLTPNEHAVSPLSRTPGSHARAYSYMSGSDEETEHAPLTLRLSQQGAIYAQPPDTLRSDRSKHKCSHTSESEEDNRYPMRQMSQTGMVPPPTVPPPPPPPIEDIPQRSPGPTRNKSFGPSVRGNYSDADLIRHQQNIDHEADLELPYLVQSAPGTVFVSPGDSQPRFPRTVPRSGSVPSSRGMEVDLPSPHSRGGFSEMYPQNYPNGEQPMMLQNNIDRQVYTFPQFGMPTIPMGGYPPAPDYGYYSKFSSASHRMKKKLKQRCTWKCTALILLIVCVALLACTVYFAAMSMFEEEEKVAPNGGSKDHKVQMVNCALNFSKNGHEYSTLRPGYYPGFDPSSQESKALSTMQPIPQVFKVGETIQSLVPPKSFWNSQIRRSADGFVAFNFTMSGSSIIGVYGRQNTPPTHIQYEFLTIFEGSRIRRRSRRAVKPVKSNMVKFLTSGDWYLGVYNDNTEPQMISLTANPINMENGCPNNCNGNGKCVDKQCQCFPGSVGWDCSQKACPILCSGKGIYMHGLCKCHPGWKGRECEFRENECQVPNCNGNGHCINGQCVCFQGFQGPDCGIEVCRLECEHGHCNNQRCVCDEGFTGALCNQLQCDHRCETHGFCSNGTCICRRGWNGKHCTIDGCPSDCSNHGDCKRSQNTWTCSCQNGWKGPACNIAMETVCGDSLDNDNDGLLDCLDPDCCVTGPCRDSKFCSASPDPKEILLSKQPPSTTASFFDKMKFLIEENSVQTYATRNAFNETQVSVIRGHVTTKDGTPLIGVKVGVVAQPLYGFTLTREQGLFDILVNGGGSVKLEFIRQPFDTKTASVLVPWNQIITMDTVVMALEEEQTWKPHPEACSTEHQHYLLRPVVLSTWQHTQLGACPERSTIIAESQVLQESLDIPGTDVHLVYHSSESPGYMSLIMIQMTPGLIPTTLSLVHLRVSVEGVIVDKVFEADPNLKYTFSWDRRNAFNQKVYGIVTARVYVGYQYQKCDYVFWETRSTTVNGFDLTSSEIGGWNLDLHHTYNFQEGILHKGDGTNIYIKEKPKKIVNILGSGQRRKLDCDDCNGKALENHLLAPVAMASGLDGSLYVGDYNFIRKLSPDRENVASILEMSTKSIPYKFYMTVSPVDGRLYISDFMSHKVIRVKTMGPVRELRDNFEDVAGNGEECTPGEADLCGDGGKAINARLRHPKGIAINKEGVIYIADGPNIRQITSDGYITTLIGTQEQLRQWTPMPCDDILSAERVSLKWPTALAVDPLDDTLHILDQSIILKLTKDYKLVTVAGRPPYCPPRQTNFLPLGLLNDDEQASSVADHVTLVSPESITFGPHGDLYVVESDSHHINRVRVVTTDGRIHHYAGAKSKCDCQKVACKCFDQKERLAAQALFSTPTSVTVTPDGIMHIADMGNLRVFSIVSELPVPNWKEQYEVVSPETQEIFMFNRYGQHQYTISIMTNQYMYNFTYNVNSFYGKLVSVVDSAGNSIRINRRYDTQAENVVAPSGITCQLTMDNMRRLYRFTAPDNTTATFTYMASTGLMESKHTSDGKTFKYRYDAMGRLLTISQPTGEITRLITDVNTTGSIVHVTTDSSDVVAMATYGSVQSVMHGSTQTKVTYLPGGAVVVLFPSNLTVAIETGEHPIMENEHRMHYKRKILVPNSYFHRLEWRFYLRRKGRTRQSRIIEKIGTRMRVGAHFPRHAHMHEWHEDGIKEKALLINGDNLLTIEYDRKTHTETIMDKDLREILTIVYDSSGLPSHFLPATGHHAMNITYSPRGDILQWQYGELREQRQYNDNGLMIERTATNGAQFRYFYRFGSKMPTDVILPSGKQYQFTHDDQGRLRSVTTPVLGKHEFHTMLTVGVQRYMYQPPGLELPFILDYDTNGKLRQIVHPGEMKRVYFRYNNHFQVSMILYDESEISFTYDPYVQSVSSGVILGRGYGCKTHYSYISSLVKEYSIAFPQDPTLLGVNFTYGYDNNFRLSSYVATFSNNFTMSTNLSYSDVSGKLSRIKTLDIKWSGQDRQVLSDDHVMIVREYDSYGRLRDVQIKFDDNVRFMLQMNYDQMNRIHQWRRRVGQTDSKAIEYIYDIDSNIVDVLLEGKSAWRYGYDANGNINKITEKERIRDLEFDVGDKILRFGEMYYKFDQDGFLVQRGTALLAFNSYGQLISVVEPEKYKFAFFYDPSDRLTLQRDKYGKVMQYFYADNQHPLRVTHTYNHTSAEVTQYLYDSKGRLMALERRQKIYYIATDPSGSPLVIFNDKGYIMKQCAYNPLGLLEEDSNPNFELSFGFQGGIYNSHTHLVHFLKRVYDAEVGRWLSPDYQGVFDKLSGVIKSPEILNLYQYRNMMNHHVPDQVLPRTDLAEWLKVLGFDIHSLAPDVSYTGNLHPKSNTLAHQLLPSSSAFECTFRRDMMNLLTISTVPQSKITPMQDLPNEEPSPFPSIFGDGVTISSVDGKVVVNVVDIASEWSRKLANVLLKDAKVVDLHYTIHGKDVHYFVKSGYTEAEKDLRTLGISTDMVTYENGMISVHRNQRGHGFGRGRDEADVRIHGNHTVINIRYGTNIVHERNRILHHAKERAISHAWKREKYFFQNNLPTYYHWTINEAKELETVGHILGFSGEYIRNPDDYPELSDDCNNIRFIKESR